MNVTRLAAAIAASIAVATVWTSAATAMQDAPVQPYRSRTDTVLFTVAVRDGATPVKGLEAKDFEISDNGVKQTIDAVIVDELPLDLSLIVDISGSTLPSVDQFTTDLQGITDKLQTRDRFRVVTFGRNIELRVPLQLARSPVARDAVLAPGGATALNDALLYALVQPAGLGRRHIIVAFTDGDDNWSWVESSRLPALAARSDATLSFVTPARPPRPKDHGLDSLVALGIRLNMDLTAIGIPKDLDPSLVDAIRNTGGQLYETGPANSLVSDAVRVLDDLRLSYVLAYVPRGVKTDGWHELKVRVPKSKAYQIRAKQGYLRLH